MPSPAQMTTRCGCGTLPAAKPCAPSADTLASVSAVAVTPDGRHVVSGSEDNTLRVWDLASGETVRTLSGHTDAVMAVAVTPDGRQAVSGSGDKTLRVWDLASGETVRTLSGHTAR